MPHYLPKFSLALSFFAFVSSAWALPEPWDANELNLAAGGMVLYEVQPRVANACREDTGADWQKALCKKKVSPKVKYRAFNGDTRRCGALNELLKIKLGTLDDMLENTDDYRTGITLRYIQEKVGANTVWIMPIFPANDRFEIPDACDNLGSPYAVRDYMHVQGSLDRYCIQSKHDEYSMEEGRKTPCWGNFALDKVIAEAHRRGMKVMLDVALNHFGHNYMYYDYTNYMPIRERIARGENLDNLWNYEATFEANLVQPEIMDTPKEVGKWANQSKDLKKMAADFAKKCRNLKGDEYVRGFAMYREMLDHERARFNCKDPVYLEYWVPGFYTGQWNGGWHPSNGLGDNFTNNWKDVKFLFHHPEKAFEHTYVRNREYMFRIMNYWVSRGIDGFRMDHTTDDASGLNPDEWKYIIGKVNFYDWVRKGRPAQHWGKPVYLAEEFGDQGGMNKVVDMMIDGYVGDMRGRDGATKNASHVEKVLDNEYRFQATNPQHKMIYILRALETHDEHRLYENTGFDMFTGGGFWGAGASARGTPMLLMGQEFGESWGLGFRRSDFLRSRFIGEGNYRENGWDLVNFYGALIKARLNPANSALLSDKHYYLRKFIDGGIDERIFAQAKWNPFDGNVVFVFHNLWPVGTVKQNYRITDELAGLIKLDDGRQYRLRNVLSGQQAGSCFGGWELRQKGLYVEMAGSERLQWLRLELCQ